MEDGGAASDFPQWHLAGDWFDVCRCDIPLPREPDRESANYDFDPFDPTFDPNPPQHHPTQTDTPRLGSPGKSVYLGQHPTSSGARTTH